jgi:O-antigen/teichoic acid export membrane protein
VFTLRRGTGIRIGFDRSQWWVWLKEAAPLALGAALDTIYFRIDIVMLSIMASDSAAGIYNIGYKFSDLMGAVPIALMTPALTLMVAAWPKDPPAFRRTFRHTYVMLLVGAIGAMAGFLVYAEPLIRALYEKPEYVAGADAARLLVVGQALHFFTLLAFTTLVAVKRNRLYPIAMLLGVVVNIGLNLILIPKYSYLGSGWATVVTEVLVLIALGAGVARIPGLRPFPWVPTMKTLGAGAVTGLVGWALLDRVPWPVGLAAIGVLYFGLVHLLSPAGPGGLRAFAGEPPDDLGPAIAGDLDRRNLGTGEAE